MLGSILEDILRITSRKSALSGLALIGTSAILLAGCAAAPAPETSGSASAFLPCMVSDSGGFDDKSFNQQGFEGLVAASKELGVEPKSATSKDESDYAPNISSLVDEGCNILVTVGFALANATRDSAKENTKVEYAIIDSALSNDDFSPLSLDNVKPILYDTAQAAFLAGYAAADYSKSGIVGTFGGQPFPSVTIFMDGFYEGVQYYNEQKGKSVQVLGWNPATPETGTFTGTFEKNGSGKTTTQGLLDQGADVILPVAGPLFEESAEAIRDSGTDAVIIGVDADLFETSPANSALFLTSVLKKMKDAVQTVVTEAAAGKFSNAPYVGTLKNAGVDIAPFHDFESKVSSTLQGELDAIKAKIISGEIVVKSASTPK